MGGLFLEKWRIATTSVGAADGAESLAERLPVSVSRSAIVASMAMAEWDGLSPSHPHSARLGHKEGPGILVGRMLLVLSPMERGSVAYQETAIAYPEIE